MSVIEVSEQILAKIAELEKLRGMLEYKSNDRANATAKYELKMATTIIQLKNGMPFKLDGNEIIAPPTTLVKEIAKGVCWEAQLEMDKADAFYKNLLNEISIVSSQLNAYQSINRYLDRT